MKNKSLGFTLVELIVVITILAILGTIAFISFQGYSLSARDSTRLSDIKLIGKTLNFYQLTEGSLPDPSESFEVSYSGSLVWRQGIFGQKTLSKTRKLSHIPLDPLTQTPYTYSLMNNRKEYAIGGLLESSLGMRNGIIPKAMANNSYSAMIKGSYNNFLVSVRQGENIYVLGVPSIIATNNQSDTLENILQNNQFSLPGSRNLPHSYKDAFVNGVSHTGGMSFISGNDNPLDPLIFGGIEETLAQNSTRQTFGETLIKYYETSILATKEQYKKMLLSKGGSESSYIRTLMRSEIGGLTADFLTDEGPTGGTTYPSENFVGVWDTLGSNSFVVPITFGPTDAVDIEYEKVGEPNVTGELLNQNTDIITLTVPSSGQYRVQIHGAAKGFSFANIVAREPEKIISIQQWGSLGWRAVSSAFFGATNLTSVPNNTQGLEGAINFGSMFRNTNFNGDISNWDVSFVNDTNGMFFGNSSFNNDISNWDISNVIQVQNMFRNATNFNQDLSSWSAKGNLITSCASFDGTTSSWLLPKPTFLNCAY